MSKPKTKKKSEKSKKSKKAEKPKKTKSEWVKRAPSKIHGGGLYAKKDIPAGTRVIEYVGERITKRESERREEKRVAAREAGKDGCVYLFELNSRYDIDGDVKWNTARLINHSCEGNCEPQGIRGKIWIVALRDIEKDEELGYDYGFDYADWREHPCRCGAPSCVGYIVKKSQRWRVKRALAAEA